jgi:hypothetical protein
VKLFSYCIPYDDGAAPNPFWGLCTLTICKPAIRRTASIGDWVIATGAKNVPNHGDLSNRLVYAMKVTNKLTLEEYDNFCRLYFPEKIPDWNNEDFRRRLGDCIYDYSVGEPSQRKCVHNMGNMETDLSGEYALLSGHFYYFGNKPVELPENLLSIVHQTQGHKSRANDVYKEEFLQWLDSKEFELNKLYGFPQLDTFKDDDCRSKCAEYRAYEEDIEC